MKVLQKQIPNHLHSSLTKRIVSGPVGKTIGLALLSHSMLSSCTPAEQAETMRQVGLSPSASPTATATATPTSPNVACSETPEHRQFVINFNAHMEKESSVQTRMSTLSDSNSKLSEQSTELLEKAKVTTNVNELANFENQGKAITREMTANNSVIALLRTELTTLQSSRPKPVCGTTSLSAPNYLFAFKELHPQHFRLAA